MRAHIANNNITQGFNFTSCRLLFLTKSVFLSFTVVQTMKSGHQRFVLASLATS